MVSIRGFGAGPVPPLIKDDTAIARSLQWRNIVFEIAPATRTRATAMNEDQRILGGVGLWLRVMQRVMKCQALRELVKV